MKINIKFIILLISQIMDTISQPPSYEQHNIIQSIQQPSSKSCYTFNCINCINCIKSHILNESTENNCANACELCDKQTTDILCCISYRKQFNTDQMNDNSKLTKIIYYTLLPVMPYYLLCCGLKL